MSCAELERTRLGPHFCLLIQRENMAGAPKDGTRPIVMGIILNYNHEGTMACIGELWFIPEGGSALRKMTDKHTWVPLPSGYGAAKGEFVVFKALKQSYESGGRSSFQTDVEYLPLGGLQHWGHVICCRSWAGRSNCSRKKRRH